jgi:ABC-type antimicrobial peptide transport system permease subunit
VVTYGELLPVLKTLERHTDSILTTVATFVYLLVGLGILNTMLMSVLERTHELGVMQALGNRPASIRALILAEAFWVATLSVAVGLAVGLTLTEIGSHRALIDYSRSTGESIQYGGAVIRSAMRTRFSPVAGLRSAALVYAITLLIGLYPAWRVSRIRPADALRTV